MRREAFMPRTHRTPRAGASLVGRASRDQPLSHERVERAPSVERPPEVGAASAAYLHLPREPREPGPDRRRLPLGSAAGGAAEAADDEAEPRGVHELVLVGAVHRDALAFVGDARAAGRAPDASVVAVDDLRVLA